MTKAKELAKRRDKIQAKKFSTFGEALMCSLDRDGETYLIGVACQPDGKYNFENMGEDWGWFLNFVAYAANNAHEIAKEYEELEAKVAKKNAADECMLQADNGAELVKHASDLQSDWDSYPPFERAATLLGITSYVDCSPHTIAEAIADIVPIEHREFWLRVEATIRVRFFNGLKNIFKDDADDCV